MPKLTDTQLILLSDASRHKEGYVSEKYLKGDTAAKAIKALLARKLLKEILAKPDMPVWRRDDKKGQSYALVMTPAGRDAINAGEPEAKTPEADDKKPRKAAEPSRRRSEKTKPSAAKAKATKEPSDAKTAPRTGSKLALVVKMLERNRGASINELTSATKWLPHTLRSVITGLRNRGYRVETERRDEKFTYRIAGKAA